VGVSATKGKLSPTSIKFVLIGTYLRIKRLTDWYWNGCRRDSQLWLISQQFKGIIGFEMVITIKYAGGIHALIVLQLDRKIP